MQNAKPKEMECTMPMVYIKTYGDVSPPASFHPFLQPSRPLVPECGLWTLPASASVCLLPKPQNNISVLHSGNSPIPLSLHNLVSNHNDPSSYPPNTPTPDSSAATREGDLCVCVKGRSSFRKLSFPFDDV